MPTEIATAKQKSRSKSTRVAVEHVPELLPTVNAFYSEPDGSVALYHGDSLELLGAMPENSIDLIFADPPYFLSNGGITCHAGKMVSVNKGKWDKSRGVEENHEFNLQWLAACRRVLTPDGSIWVSGTSHIIYSVGLSMQQLGFKLLNDIIWYKRNAPPNLSCRYFTHSTETVLWAAKSDKSKHTFHYQEMRRQANGKQMRNYWLFDVDPAAEPNGEQQPDKTATVESGNGETPENVWQLGPPSAPEKVYGKHPTQKPMALLRRIVQAASNPGEIVLDPFNGSGTTGLAAVELGRRYVGMDAEQAYLELTVKRLRDLPRAL